MVDKSKVRYAIKKLLDTNIPIEKLQQMDGRLMNSPLTPKELELLDRVIFICEDCGYWTSKDIFYMRNSLSMCSLCAADYDSRNNK